MARIIQIITFFILSLFMMSSSCDKGSEGCTNSSLCDYNGDGVFDEDENCACNYDETATIDDNSCWFASEGCDCEDPVGSLIDCLEICDVDIINDPPVDNDGNCCSILDDDCELIVVGGCIDEANCKYDEENPPTHNNGSCAVDLYQYGGFEDGTDFDGSCEGEAVMDGCDNPNCIGGLLSDLEAWKIKISAKATFKSTISDSLLWIDSSTVTLGASEFALDGFNNVEQEGGSNNCSDSCYIDFFEPDPELNIFSNQIRFYFPHEEWLNELNSDTFHEPNFVQDIRYYDLKALFSSGIQWDAIISPINLTYGSIVEELSISYKFEGAIDKCKFIISIDGNPAELLEGEFLNYSVNSNEEIQLLINISNICIE